MTNFRQMCEWHLQMFANNSTLADERRGGARQARLTKGVPPAKNTNHRVPERSNINLGHEKEVEAVAVGLGAAVAQPFIAVIRRYHNRGTVSSLLPSSIRSAKEIAVAGAGT